MGLFSSSKNDSKSDRGRDDDQADPKWSFWGGSSKPSARAVERERRNQNPNGWRRSGKW